MKPSLRNLWINGKVPGRLFTAVVIWLLSAQLNGLQAVPPERFAAVKRYWEWSAYWGIDGLDFPQATYRPGRSFRALVFSSDNVQLGKAYWGFCSRELSLCQVYSTWPDHTVYQARGTRMRKVETEAVALKRFQEQEFLSDQEAKNISGLQGVHLLAGPPDGTANGRDAPTASADENALRTTVQTIKLPALGDPEAIRHRSANRFVDDWIRAQGKGKCTVIVPYSDVHSPLVPVLSLCPGEHGIQFMRKDGDEWIATAGGWMTNEDIVRRFEPLIRNHASLTVRP